MTSNLSHEDYLEIKLKPIFNSLTESIVKEYPEDPILFMYNWLRNYKSGECHYYNENAEKKELNDLRKELNKLKKKYEGMMNNEEMMNSGTEDEEEDNEDQDKVNELIEQRKQNAIKKGHRSSVSAEAYGEYNKKKAFVPKVISKTKEQEERINNKVLKSFIFNNLDSHELKTVVDAMEETTCKPQDKIIKQGENGDVLYIIEKGEYDCFKQFEKDKEPIKVKEYFPGDSFGELALLYNAPRAASIIAKTDGVLWTLDRETFNNIVKASAINKREKYESFLKSVNILKSIEPYELSQICDAVKTKKYSDGEYIIKQYEEGDDFYIIESGEAVATKILNEGEKAKEVKEYSMGGYFGELALIKNEPRAANVIAKGNCEVLYLDRKSFKRLLGPIENILKRNFDDYNKYINKVK